MSKIVDKTGETIIAKNGLKMTIIVYRTVRDIDIQFEDGYVREHISYYNFLTGRIKHPDYKGRLKSKLGESNVANNGMNMTIIAYRGTADLDIQFEDGIIVCNKSYMWVHGAASSICPILSLRTSLVVISTPHCSQTIPANLIFLYLPQ